MRAVNEPASAAPRLVVALTAHDSMRTIPRTLESVAGLADRIVVVDSGSTDGTVETCRAAGAEVIHRAWPGFIAQRQFLLDHCADARWILLLDSDESVEPTLSRSIREAIEADGSDVGGAIGNAVDGFEINRKLHYAGAWLNHAFQPEWRLRLVRGGRAVASGRLPHDRVDVPGAVRRLQGDLRHDSFADLEDMLRRQLAYARISAEHGARGGRLANVLISPATAFLKQAIVKGGFRDGWRGIVLAGGAAAGTLMKHLFVMQRRRGGDLSDAIGAPSQRAPQRGATREASA